MRITMNVCIDGEVSAAHHLRLGNGQCVGRGGTAPNKNEVRLKVKGGLDWTTRRSLERAMGGPRIANRATTPHTHIRTKPSNKRAFAHTEAWLYQTHIKTSPGIYVSVYGN